MGPLMFFTALLQAFMSLETPGLMLTLGLVAGFWQLLCAIEAMITPLCGLSCSWLTLFRFVRPVLNLAVGLVFALISLGELASAFACARDDTPCVEFKPRFYSFIVFVMLLG